MMPNEQIAAMLRLQDQLNRQINPGWLNAGYAWHRAIWIEAAELMDHYGWKWWKAQKPDMGQVLLELIDIWHFGLSAELVHHAGDQVAAVEALAYELETGAHDEADFHANVDRLAQHALKEQRLHMPSFLALLHVAGADFSGLFRTYMGKNVLNRFRQDHGYKTGTYLKTWSGREDNVHLEELIDVLADTPDESFEQKLYDGLSLRYEEALADRSAFSGPDYRGGIS